MLSDMSDTANRHREARVGLRVMWPSVTGKDFVEKVELLLGLDAQVGKFLIARTTETKYGAGP